MGDGAARGHDVAERVRLVGGQHPGHQGGDHRVLQVSRPLVGSPCPARGPEAPGPCPRLQDAPRLGPRLPSKSEPRGWRRQTRSQAWGHIPESLHSGLLLRGEMETQEWGPGSRGGRGREGKAIPGSSHRLFLIQSSPNGGVRDLPHPSEACPAPAFLPSFPLFSPQHPCPLLPTHTLSQVPGF